MLRSPEPDSLPQNPDFTYAYQNDSYNLVDTVTGPAHMVDNTWEGDRDVLSEKENTIGGTVFSSYDYTVNDIGQREGMVYDGTAVGGGDGAFAFGYNARGEVADATRDPAPAYPVSGQQSHTYDYGFDAIGNREAVTTTGSGSVGDGNYTANAENQYTAIDSLNPSYDADGNATSYPVPEDPGSNATLDWDAENRLISSTVDGTTTTYQYDHLGRRIAKTTGSTTTMTIYEEWNPIADYTVTEDEENAGEFVAELDRTYLWGKDLSGSMQGAGGVGGLLALVDESASGDPVSYPCYDGNGNVTEYMDDAGSLEARFTYDPFGNTISNTDTAGKFDIRFSTKRRDVETGLYYYGYRYYDPVTGRWPSRDPIEEQGGLNLYGFVGNDGVNGWEFLGLSESCEDKGDIGNIRNLEFFINIKTFGGTDMDLKDPTSTMKDLIDSKMEGEEPDDKLKKKLEDVSEAAASGFDTFLRAINVIQNLRELSTGITITMYAMEAEMECCKCVEDEEKWVKVGPASDNWMGQLSMTNEADRKKLWMEVKDVTISVAEQLAESCPKE